MKKQGDASALEAVNKLKEIYLEKKLQLRLRFPLQLQPAAKEEEEEELTCWLVLFVGS